jgi:hypothetical protein
LANEYEEQIIARISECSLVVDKLNNDPAWKIILNDLDLLRKQIDGGWQEIQDPQKLERARVMKYAITHLMNTKQNYEDELKAAQAELKKMQEPEKETQKDYDLDTTIEQENTNE